LSGRLRGGKRARIARPQLPIRTHPAENGFRCGGVRGSVGRLIVKPKGKATKAVRATERSPSRKFLLFIGGYLGVLLLCSYWIPGSDYDSLAMNVVRATLERFGPLQETAFSTQQIVLPKTFDYIVAFFLERGHFSTLPSLVLFAVLVAVILLRFRDVATEALWFLFSAQVILVGIASLKNDVPLGVVVFLAWLHIFLSKNSSYYLPLALALLSALVGIKWHGAFFAAVFFAVLLFRLFRDRRPSWTAIVVCVALSPVLFELSSAAVYINNLVSYGSLFPRSSEWGFIKDTSVSNFFRNWTLLFYFGVIDTFQFTYHLSDAYLNTDFWGLLYKPFADSMAHGYRFMPDSIAAFWGIPIVVLLVCLCIAIWSRSIPFSLRFAAGTSIAYMVFVCSQITLNGSIRYLAPGYVLGVVPAAAVLRRFRIPPAVRFLAAFYLVIVSLNALVWQQERRLLPIEIYDVNTRQRLQLASVWYYLDDLDMLYFSMMGSYAEPYRAFRNNVRKADRLMVVNDGAQTDAPFFFPFLKDREPANTKIVNLRRGGTIASDLSGYDYVLTYRYELNRPDFERIYAFPGRYAVSIYRRNAAANRN